MWERAVVQVMWPGLARMVAMEVEWVDSIGFGNKRQDLLTAWPEERGS